MSDINELYSHVSSLHRFATGLVGNPVDAEDMVQECLRRILDRHRRGAPIHNLKAYLFQTLRNIHIDQCRQRSGREAQVNDVDQIVERLSVPPNQEQRLRCADIAEALDRLPDKQREVLLLVCLEGLTYDQVAAITGNPVGTVRSRLHRARSAMQDMLDPIEPSEEYERPGMRVPAATGREL